MCQGRLDFAAIERSHGVRVTDRFAPELVHLDPLVDAGLVEREAAAIQVTRAGWYVVRAVAMLFDRHLLGAGNRDRFSRIL